MFASKQPSLSVFTYFKGLHSVIWNNCSMCPQALPAAMLPPHNLPRGCGICHANLLQLSNRYCQPVSKSLPNLILHISPFLSTYLHHVILCHIHSMLPTPTPLAVFHVFSKCFHTSPHLTQALLASWKDLAKLIGRHAPWRSMEV